MRGLPGRLGYVHCLSRSGGRLGLSPECRDKQWLGPCSSRPGAALIHHRGAEERTGLGVGGASAAVGMCCVKNKLSKQGNRVFENKNLEFNLGI